MSRSGTPTPKGRGPESSPRAPAASPTFDSHSRASGGTDRTSKAMFAVHERPGQTWLWVPDPILAFVPATVIEVSKVRCVQVVTLHERSDIVWLWDVTREGR